jgi:hypothetical protein
MEEAGNLTYSMRCAPISGATNDFRLLAAQSIFSAENTVKNVMTVPSWDLFRSKWAHHPKSLNTEPAIGHDCTHYCWSSQLFEPLWQRLFYALYFRK